MFRRTRFCIGVVTCGLMSIFAAKALAQDSPEYSSRPLWTTISDAAGTLESCPDESCPSDGWWDDECQSRWTISADALILDRVTNSTNTVGGFTGPVLVSGPSFNFSPATGPRISAIYHWDDELAAEINYLGIHGWHSEITQSSGGLSFFGPFSILAGNTAGGFEYGSRIDSGEFNLRWSPAEATTWIAGFRYVEWSEMLHGFMSPPFNSYHYLAQTNNQLYGGQIGLDCRWWDRGGPMQWNTIVKAGGYSNTAFVHNGLHDPDKDSKTAFLGEVATVGRWEISDIWALRGGYQLMWLSGIAVAPDNLRFPVIFPADLSGGVFLHGAIVGIEATW